MPTPFGARIYFDLGVRCDEADLADNDVVVTGVVMPVAGTVKAIYVGASVLPTTGTLAVAKSATTAVNLLSAATVDLAALTANVGASQTLATVPASLEVVAGDIIKATWTLTDITVTDDAVLACTVAIEPKVW